MDNQVSIIIPVYNKEKYIGKTLESVLLQTYKNVEIVVVNDGSTDGTEKIINKYAEKYPTIKAINKENGGVTNARLTGIKASKGDWIGFVDGDDYVEPEMFEALIDNALKYNTDISHCGCQMVSVDGSDVAYLYNTGRIAKQNNVDALRDLLCGVVYEPSLCNKLFNKKLFNNMLNSNLMDTSIKINEDLLMNYWLFKEAGSSIFEDKCYYHYVSTENSATKCNFTSDPIKVMKIIYNDVTPELKDLMFSRLLRQLIIYSSMTLRRDKEIRKPCRKSARKELRGYFGKTIKSKISSKVKIMALWTAIWPWSYGFFHRTYGKLSGKTNEYMLN